MPRYRRALSAVLAVPLLVQNVAALGQTFTGLGLPAGSNPASSAGGVSGDGSVVVGWTTTVAPPTASNLAFRWTSQTGRVQLPLATGYVGSFAGSASANGGFMAGSLVRPSGDSIAARWTAGASSAQALGTLPGGLFSAAYAISRNGSFVVGNSDHDFAVGPQHAFRWTSGVGMQDLGSLPNFVDSAATSVSDDGSVVVGTCDDLAADYRAWRWTAAGGIQDLGSLPGVGDSNFAADVSGDGSIVVGQSGNTAFRWTAATGMQALPAVAGSTGTNAAVITGDGSIIAGSAVIGFQDRAAFWDSDGAHDFSTFLGSLLPQGWVLLRITGISDDGLTFVGQGLHDGVAEGWVATVPGPGTLALAPIVVAAAFRRQRGGASRA